MSMHTPEGYISPDTSPSIAIQHEHPPELLQYITDQLTSLDMEIKEWEERLWRLRTCRDSLGVASQYLQEVLQQQNNPAMTMSPR